MVLGAAVALAAGRSAGTGGSASGEDFRAEVPAAGGAAPAAPETGGDAPAVPGNWEETVSGEWLAHNGDGNAVLLEHLRIPAVEVGTLDAADIAGTPGLSGLEGLHCEGETAIDGSSVECTYLNGDGETVGVQVHLVRTAFGGAALLSHEVVGGFADFAVPQGTEIAIAQAGDLQMPDATEEDLARVAESAISLSERPDGDPPEALAADCEVLDDAEHAVCEITGSTGGAADGYWYLTAQNGWRGDLTYVVTRLPEGDTPGC